MANIFESAFMTLKNGMTMYFADSKARQWLQKLQEALAKKYGPDNPPPSTAGKIWYATCSTASGTGAKVATSSTGDFVLATGSMVRVKFTTSNTAANPTISIDGSSAKTIQPKSGTSGMANLIAAGEVVDLVYDGTNFIMTKGNAATTSFYGITKLSSATNSTAEDVAATPKAVKDAADSKVDRAGDTMTGDLYVAKAGNALVQAENSNTGVKLNLDTGSSANHGIYSYGYYDGSSFHSAAGWMIYRDSSGNVIVNGKAENVTGTVAVANGGTGATTAAAANANLHNYNLLEGLQIAYNTDLNTIVAPNIYRTTSDAITASLVNKPPVTQPFQLAVMCINGDYTVMQHVNEWLSGNEWRRFGYISGGSWTWGAWHKISEPFPLSVESGGTGATSGANALANLGVTEAFSSGNGSLKLPNGTLIQWGVATLNVANALTQIATSGVYQGTTSLTFPIAFANDSYYLSGIVRYSTGYEIPCGFSQSSSTYATIRIYDFYARPASSSDYKLYWFAIGRWA